MPWSSLVQVFDFGGQWGKATARLVEGNDAAVVVKRVESIIEDAMKVLQSHERLLDSREYKSFSVVHRRLLLKVIEVKQVVQEQEGQNLFSGSPADRRRDRVDREVALLHGQAKIFYRDVVTASRRAQDAEDLELSSDDVSDPSPGSSQEQQLTTWYSIIAPQTNPGTPDATSACSETATLVEPYLAVAHIREQNEGGDAGKTNETCRFMFIMENEGKRMIFINPNLCHLKDGFESINESSLLEMWRAGEVVFRAADPGNLEGVRVVSNQPEPSWVESMIQTMSKLGVGVGSQMV